MPAGEMPVRGFEIFTQRASTDDRVRRESDEPIGREFADLVHEAQKPQDPEPAPSTKAEAPVQEQPPTSEPTQAPLEAQGPADPVSAQAAPSPSPQAEETTASEASVTTHVPAPPTATATAITGILAQLQGLGAVAESSQTVIQSQPQTPAAPSAGDPLADAEVPTAPASPTKPAESANGLAVGRPDVATRVLPETAAPAAVAATAPTRAPGAVTAPRGNAFGNPLNLETPPATGELPPTARNVAANLPAADSGPGANRFAATNVAPSIDADVATSSASGTQTQTQGVSSQASPAAAAVPNKPAGQPAAAVNAPPIDVAAPTAPIAQTGGSSFSAGAAATTTTQSVGHAAAPSSSTPPPALASAPQAVMQVYSRFVERFDGKAQQFQIRLDPPELGRVNVRIEIGADHRVHAVLAAHDSNALGDLMRGQRALEQSLASAGIDLADDGIRFELSDQNTNQSSKGEQDSTPNRRPQPWNLDADTSAAIEQAVASQSRWSRTRINVVA